MSSQVPDNTAFIIALYPLRLIAAKITMPAMVMAGIVIGTGLAFGALLTVRAPNVAPVPMLEFAAWIVIAFVAFVDIRVQSLITGGSLVTTLNTRYGVLHLTLTIAAFLGAIAVSGGKRRWELLITAIIAVLLSESLSGHGGTGVLPAVGVTFDLAHLLAAAAWIGVLLTALMATEIVDVRRTSNVATYAVILLLVSSVVQVLRNVISILREAGGDAGDVLKCNVYLADIRYFQAMNEVFAEVFSVDPPARTTVQAALAEPEMLVEIEAIAFIGAP